MDIDIEKFYFILFIKRKHHILMHYTSNNKFIYVLWGKIDGNGDDDDDNEYFYDIIWW